MNNTWLYPLIILGGVLQAAGAPINARLKDTLGNPWLAASVSFLLVTLLCVALFCMHPHPLPGGAQLRGMKWWAPLGGVVGAIAVFAGLTLVQKVGVGTLNGLTVCANLVASVAIDHFGVLGVASHPVGPARLAGAVFMIVGVAMIMRF